MVLALLHVANTSGSDYTIRILNNIAIFIILAVSYNLINGITGQFSLAPNAFVAIGSYTSALLILTPMEKEISFIIEPCIWPLSVITTPFIVSLIAAGVVAALLAFLMGFPVFRTRGDYLAIVTLGFGEVVRVIANNTQSITNGPLGLKGIADYTNIWWAWGFAIITIFLIGRMIRSSYGMAMKAVKFDQAAAEAVGINTYWHKMLAFTTSAFFQGVGGGLLAHLITTISPVLFTFFLTFNLLIIIVAGGWQHDRGDHCGHSRHLGRRGAPVLRGADASGVHRHPGYSRHEDGHLLLHPRTDHDLRAAGSHGNPGIQLELAVQEARHRRSFLMALLAVEHITMKFGGLVAVNDFDLALEKNEIVGLIGPNGAGKTTVFNMIAGYYIPTEGDIRFMGKSIGGQKANQITKAGIARTFQNIRLFSELSVIENVMIGYHCRIKSTFIGATLRLPRYCREEKMMREGAMNLLKEVGLEDVAGEMSTSLPYGKQRRLEIARALATGPQLLLLDEPAAGMNPSETQDLLQLILKLRKDYDLTVFLIEHDMKFVMEICERLKVLDYGTTIAEGTPHEIQNNPKVIEAYLGEVQRA